MSFLDGLKGAGKQAEIKSLEGNNSKSAEGIKEEAKSIFFNEEEDAKKLTILDYIEGSKLYKLLQINI